ncbi:lysM and putative peptidoglycan-binding domain-containing protein 3-like [Oppia nitens]|uniref:lysM and putative peptidoglycan-binding domain-containing protein 3-like n=1 Tax=Oppia nitens TaxID=1686743 RepID=UPI0023DA157D|nr:lysM and putative peptidoglycan-binding domain-containing protein 3-like [Oppia nitens]
MKSVYNKTFRSQNDYKSVKYERLSDPTAITANDDEDQTFELKNRQRVSPKRSQTEAESLVEYIPYWVQSGDTLRAIALRYGCSVSQIKQINHIMSDHEFYGLRTVRLPVKKYGILSDVLVHQIHSQLTTADPNDSSKHLDDDHMSSSSDGNSSSLTVNIGISQHLGPNNGTKLENKFLSHMDEDLKRIRESTQTVIESSDITNLEQSLAVDENVIQFIGQKKSQRSAFSCDESDYGINWCNLLLLAFVVCFLLPVIYVIYHSETHSEINNHNNTLDNYYHHIHSHH